MGRQLSFLLTVILAYKMKLILEVNHRYLQQNLDY